MAQDVDIHGLEVLKLAAMLKDVGGDYSQLKIRVHIVSSDVPFSGGGSVTKKTGLVAGTSFAGSPKKYSVVFATAYASTGYVIALEGTDPRSYTYENKTVNGFDINTNAATAIAGEVSWTTFLTGETT